MPRPSLFSYNVIPDNATAISCVTISEKAAILTFELLGGCDLVLS